MTVEEFVCIANTNLDSLYENSVEKEDNGMEVIYRCCLQFTKKYINELYLSQNNKTESKE
jgi:hypothetical protein